MLDKDGSNYIDLKELMFKLTGVKQFDLELIIANIKESTKEKGETVFNAFLKIDSDKNFLLSSVDELVQVFDLVDDKIQLEPDHYQQIYDKFATRKNQFEYLLFLRYFCSVEQIFMKCCQVIIQTMFKGKFEEFYKVGLKGDQRKWKRDSLTLVNDMTMLRFK